MIRPESARFVATLTERGKERQRRTAIAPRSAACTRRSASIASWMSASECAGESGSDSTSEPARSATGSDGWSGIALAVVGEAVDGQEVDARPDVLGRQGLLVLVARGSGPLGVDPYDVEVHGVEIALAPFARERLDPGELGEGSVVGGDVPKPDRAVPLELVELDERDRRVHVREVGLEARVADVVERAVRRAASAGARALRRRARRWSVVMMPPSPAATFFVA